MSFSKMRDAILQDIHVKANTEGIQTRYESNGDFYLFFLKNNVPVFSFRIAFELDRFKMYSGSMYDDKIMQTVHYNNAEEWLDFWDWFKAGLQGTPLARTTRK